MIRKNKQEMMFQLQSWG